MATEIESFPVSLRTILRFSINKLIPVLPFGSTAANERGKSFNRLGFIN